MQRNSGDAFFDLLIFGRMADVPKRFANHCDDPAWFIVSFLAERREEAAAADLYLESRFGVC